MSELTIGKALKTTAYTVLAIVGFFVLWVIAFIPCWIFTFGDFGISLLASLFISGGTTLALVLAFTRNRPKPHYVLTKRQKIGALVAYAVLFIVALAFIMMNPSVFIIFLPGLALILAGVVRMVRDSLRSRKAQEMSG